MNEPKTINKAEKSFMANGTKYYITDKVSVARFKEYEKLSIKLTYGVDFKSMFSTLKKVYAALNDKRFADSSVMVHNLMSGIAEAEDEKRTQPALMLCTLFINRDGEDVGVYDEAICLEKISDWEKEGINMLDFFHLALSAIHGFRETYIEYIRNQVNEMEKEKLLQSEE